MLIKISRKTLLPFNLNLNLNVLNYENIFNLIKYFHNKLHNAQTK